MTVLSFSDSEQFTPLNYVNNWQESGKFGNKG